MLHPAIDCPAFGPEIQCPHCHRIISALFLTDTYLCPRHGAFEVSTTGELVHVLSGRCWHQWKGTWYRQHIHIDGLRFEIGEALDQLHRQGRRATQITIAQRYQVLFEGGPDRALTAPKRLYPLGQKLFSIPLVFSPTSQVDPQWTSVNFEFITIADTTAQLSYPRFRTR
jgi:uncharacterized protein (TIGR02652 family)